MYSKKTNRVKYWRRILSTYVLSAKDSNIAFWHTPLRANDMTDDDLKTLSVYPQNFEEKIGRIKTTDAKGVIMLDYKGDLGLQYNPNAIAQLALGYYDRVAVGEDCREEFFVQAEHFLDHGRLLDDVLLWEYEFPFENRNYQESPWRSALAQGQGISVCLRAHQLGGGERYLDAAKNAFNSFRYLSRDHEGGVLDDSRGYTWLEEYIFNPPNHVLNGFIWALWGVRDYAVYFDDGYAWSLWNSCLKTLVENVCHYDVGYWTSYDLVKFNDGDHPTMPASTYYQELHCVQMDAMHRLSGHPIFKEYSERWRRQLSSRLSRLRSQTWKSYFKLTRF